MITLLFGANLLVWPESYQVHTCRLLNVTFTAYQPRGDIDRIHTLIKLLIHPEPASLQTVNALIVTGAGALW